MHEDNLGASSTLKICPARRKTTSTRDATP